MGIQSQTFTFHHKPDAVEARVSVLGWPGWHVTNLFRQHDGWAFRAINQKNVVKPNKKAE